MGGIRRGKKRGPRGGNGGGSRREAGQPGNYKDIQRENEKYEEFFRKQGICKDEAEFQEMMSTFKRDLPSSFRVTGFRSQALALRNVIESKYFKDLAASESKDLPKCLDWYPDRLGWQLGLTRKEIRREESYFKLHNFMISETESGNISRQETVSMIPPLVLGVEPHHKVLDMCAAPGSKTAQLIEAVHAEEGTVPKGLVVANDADNSRCYMLVHQAKRLQSPNYIITNHDASCMPKLEITKEDGTKVPLKFDRVLCDVPCSGDGTLRKNIDIWPKWNPANSCTLHGIQYRIAKRGLEMLEVGGRLVYSTCALQPVEDEAVVCRLLKEAEGTVELLDASTMVPGLKYKQGLHTWTPASKTNQFFSSWEDVPQELQSMLRPTMFPPEPEEAKKLKLERCMRILPHLQDTGGFFVALLVKNAPCPWESKKYYEGNGSTESEDKDEGLDENGKKRKGNSAEDSRQRKKPRYQGFKEDPFIYLDKSIPDPVFTEVKEYFDIKEDLAQSMFLTRCPDVTKKNNLYYTSHLVRNIVENNTDRVKIINTGIKAFAKCENKGALCPLRLAQDGCLMTIPFLGERRIVRPTKEDLVTMLMCNDIEVPPALTELDPQTREQLEKLDTGSVALVFEGTNDDGTPLKVELVGWKGKASVRAYVPKNDRVHYLRLIGADTSKYEVNKFEARRMEEKTKGNAQTNEGNLADDDAEVKDPAEDVKEACESEEKSVPQEN